MSLMSRTATGRCPHGHIAILRQLCARTSGVQRQRAPCSICLIPQEDISLVVLHCGRSAPAPAYRHSTSASCSHPWHLTAASSLQHTTTPSRRPARLLRSPSPHYKVSLNRFLAVLLSFLQWITHTMSANAANGEPTMQQPTITSVALRHGRLESEQ